MLPFNARGKKEMLRDLEERMKQNPNLNIPTRTKITPLLPNESTEYVLSPTGHLWQGHESQEDFDHNSRLLENREGYVRNEVAEKQADRVRRFAYGVTNPK